MENSTEKPADFSQSCCEFNDKKHTMSHRKQTDDLNRLLGQVIAVRRAASVEYELRLKNYLIQRANGIQNGIYNGVRLPKIERTDDTLLDKLQQNHETTERAHVTTDKYLYAKTANEYLRKERKDKVETLKKFGQIQKTMQSDDA